MQKLPIHLEVLELTKKLIRIPSTHSRQGEIRRCADFIESWLSKNEIAYTRHDFCDVPSITVLPQQDYTPVLLLSHFDVIETEDDTLFEPWEINGNLYARGSIDDKYAVALSLVLFKEHLNTIRQSGGGQQDMHFGLLLTGDEEIGGANGTGMVAETMSTDFFIAIDGGSPELIVNKEKGILQLQLTAKGKAAHGARPWLGQNAFDILIDDYRNIQKMFTETTAEHWHKTMVLSNCLAGSGSVNIVPDRATATMDIRYTENDNPAEILAHIQNTVQSEVTITALEPVFSSGPSPYLDLLVRHSNNATIGFEHGASDARFLSRRGIPGAVFGAEGEMSQHTINEHIVLSSLYDLYDRLNSYLLDVKRQDWSDENTPPPSRLKAGIS